MPRVVGDVVLVGHSEGGMVTLSLAQGREINRLEAGHGFGAAVEVAEGLGGVLSNAGTLFVFGVR
jgi:outer membrane protein assembly factor BamB